MKTHQALLFLLAAACLTTAAGEGKRELTFEDMFSAQRISNVDLSPDGKSALFEVKRADFDGNGYKKRVYMVTLETGKIEAMTPADVNCGAPVWRPDGKAFCFSKDGQLFLQNLAGGEPVQLTTRQGGASDARFSPDGKWILFTGGVSTADPNKDHSGYLIDQLFFRVWNSWVVEDRQHVFLAAANGEGEPPRDLTPGEVDSPPLDLGSSHDYSFSPDGREVAVVKNTDPIVAVSTNNDIFLIDAASGKERRLTSSKGSDAEPHYSPDGRYIAYRNMKRAGFEADQQVIWVHDRKTDQARPLTENAPYSVNELIWSPDSSHLYYTANIHGERRIFQVDLSGKITQLTEGYYDSNPVVDAAGETVVFTREATTFPAEVFALDVKSGEVRQITNLNGEAFADIEMNPWESFWFDSENGAKVQGFVIKPPHFDPQKKYPMVYLIHGGPQGMWANNFHYRWNSQMFAAPGYVVVLVNPHGSKGYGQKFCDAVTKDWGGLPYRDLMKGVDVALERYPFIDANRIGAAGASYGGYMVNWIATQNDRFDCLVSHNGLFNLPSMGGLD